MHTKQRRIQNLELINSAATFAAEQQAMQGHPGVDVVADFPQEMGQLWRMHHHQMTDADIADYAAICRSHHLPFERGTRAYYVGRAALRAVVNGLTSAGFMVALRPDACRAYSET